MDRGRNLDAGLHFEEASRLQQQQQQQHSGEGEEEGSGTSSGGGQEEEGLYESLFNAGVAYRQGGNLEKAEEFYRKAKDLRPQVRKLIHNRRPSIFKNIGMILIFDLENMISLTNRFVTIYS